MHQDQRRVPEQRTKLFVPTTWRRGFTLHVQYLINLYVMPVEYAHQPKNSLKKVHIS